jgi:hypothetical protein
VNELPRSFPPIRSINHHIDLIPGASLPNKAAYRLTPQENEEVNKQAEESIEVYEACENHVLRDRSQWTKYMIQDGLLFKDSQLCIPKCSMRDNLLKEKHSGGIA